jgi:putative ABC transport system ATP-binding protein
MSGGQQQRVAVARALVTRPAVVFGDEPTGNLDSVSSREVLELMRRAVDELGQTIVMVTHDPAAASIADRVVFLADGRISDTRERPSIDEILDHLRALAP